MPSRAQCCHDHDCADSNCAASYSLYKHIDIEKVTCLNEAQVPRCAFLQGTLDYLVWELQSSVQALERKNKFLSNQGDPELLISIPFGGAVNLKAISIIGGFDGRSPSRMKAYTNRELDFDSVAELAPIQSWDLQEDFRGVLEYPTVASKFKGVHLLTLHFPEIIGDADRSEIYFIGLKGEFIERKKEAVEAVYEARPMPEDHQVPGEHGNIWRMGM